MKEVRHYVAQVLCDLCTKEFSDICRKRRSKEGGYIPNVFAGGRPSAGPELDEFLVIRTSSNIGDHWVYQQASLYVQIYVRNLENGLRNIMRLQELEDNVIGKFPIVTKRYSVKNPSLQIGGDDELGFSVWLVRANLQFNTTDRFALPEKE